MDWKIYIRYFAQLVAEQTEDVSIVSFLAMALLGIIMANLIWLIKERRTGKAVPADTKRVIWWIIIYACIIFQITFYSREPGSRNGLYINLDFGDYNGSSWSVKQMIYTILNVILFVPLGILAGILKREYAPPRRVVMCTIYAFLTSFLIEVFQLATKRGYFELTDIVTNTLGGLIGVLLVSLIYALRKSHNLKGSE